MESFAAYHLVMNKTQVMKQLETLGTAQNRKVYSRHAGPVEMFGVSYANLGKLQKQIKVDHELAEQLWATGNLDAQTFEAEIHGAKNYTRYGMNNALISIGIRNPKLQKKAVAAAKRIGKVEVDHGQTSCKTPDAVPYIAKAVAHKASKAKKKKAKKKLGRQATA